MKFETGQRVKVVKAPKGKEYMIGVEGVVSRRSGVICYPYVVRYDLPSWVYAEDELEAVNYPSPPPEPDLKIGDTVKCLGQGGAVAFLRGGIGNVVDINLYSVMPYRVCVLDTDRWFRRDELERVSTE